MWTASSHEERLTPKHRLTGAAVRRFNLKLLDVLEITSESKRLYTIKLRTRMSSKFQTLWCSGLHLSFRSQPPASMYDVRT